MAGDADDRECRPHSRSYRFPPVVVRAARHVRPRSAGRTARATAVDPPLRDLHRRARPAVPISGPSGQGPSSWTTPARVIGETPCTAAPGVAYVPVMDDDT